MPYGVNKGGSINFCSYPYFLNYRVVQNELNSPFRGRRVGIFLRKKFIPPGAWQNKLPVERSGPRTKHFFIFSSGNYLPAKEIYYP
jgi:hypothetical protein